MRDPFKKVQPGNRLRIPAVAYNRLMDMARNHHGMARRPLLKVAEAHRRGLARRDRVRGPDAEPFQARQGFACQPLARGRGIGVSPY